MNSPAITPTEAVTNASACFHCGEPVPVGLELTALIDGERRSMCCPGCQAIAQMIQGSGLTGFYHQRTSFSPKPVEDGVERDEYSVYDEPSLADTFSQQQDDGTMHSALLVGGISCAACTWLIERTLLNMPGVIQAQVNLARHRLDITLDIRRTRLSDVFGQLATLGYRPLPFKESARQQQQRQAYNTDLRRLGVAGLGMMQVGMFAIALHAGDMQGMAAQHQALLRWVSLPVAGFVVWYAARPFFSSAWRHLRAGALVMDLPVALAIGLAFLASAWATLSGNGDVYFDSVVMFTFFLLLARFLEARARARGEPDWLELHRTLPDAVKRWDDNGWVSSPRLSLAPGDRILVRPGERIPADAHVINGDSAVREEAFTGESQPRAVSAGATLYAGTLNIDGPLEASVCAADVDSRLSALSRIMDVAASEKPALARLADRIAGWFVAGILIITALTAWYWWQQAPDRTLWVVLSVLVISCPCALALATPAALTSATATLRQRGIWVRGDHALEALLHCSHLILDKTGTLTSGKLSRGPVHLLGDLDEPDVLAICAALQHHSNHPIAHAFRSITATTGLSDVQSHAGQGIEGRAGSRHYRMGNHHFCTALTQVLPEPPRDGRMWVALVSDQQALAWIPLQDEVRAEAAVVVAEARELGMTVEILSGDSSAHVEQVARQLDIAACKTEQSPEDKLAHVGALQSADAKVCMVGDGINDGPVLRAAQCSFAMVDATDLARAQADYVLLTGDLTGVITTWRMAARCRRVIRQNLAWAVLYNASAIPLAVAGLVPPWAAALGMSASSLIVVVNSLRLTRPE